MNLDDYSLSESERIFSEKATMIIYDWLSDDERLKFNSELISEGFFGIDDLRVKDRLFRARVYNKKGSLLGSCGYKSINEMIWNS